MSNKRGIRFGTAVVVFVVVAMVLIAFNRGKSGAAATPPPPPEARVAVVEQRDLLVRHQWIGTLNGLVNAAVNAQVTGYLLRQDYTEGSFVHKGQLLFEIDPRPFHAAVDQAAGLLAQSRAQLSQAQAVLVQAQAQLLSAEANQHKSQLDEEKYAPLFEEKAVTRQDLDNAVQMNRSNVAQVAAAKAQAETSKAQIEAAGAAVKAAEAALETANVNLGFTRLTSLIDGVAGAATVQVGNLVAPASPAVTTVSTLDPVKAVFTVSEREYLALSRANVLHHLQLKLVLADGTTHPLGGRFSFADRQVDPGTGAIQMTALFPNPGAILRPGQYAMVRAVTGENKGALLVPQPAVTELQGGYEVLVLGAENKVATRHVQVGDRVGTMWVITRGLNPGDRVVVEGQQKLRSGMRVQPKPFPTS
jgi:membrane fusion protein (multidrug efflux system)